jgi:hypothetical protein
MVSALLSRILKVAFHFAIVGSVVDIEVQAHHSLRDAVIHAVTISFCIVLIAVAGYVAMRLLSSGSGDFTVTVNWAPKKKLRAAKQTRNQIVTEDRKPTRRRG